MILTGLQMRMDNSCERVVQTKLSSGKRATPSIGFLWRDHLAGKQNRRLGPMRALSLQDHLKSNTGLQRCPYPEGSWWLQSKIVNFVTLACRGTGWHPIAATAAAVDRSGSIAPGTWPKEQGCLAIICKLSHRIDQNGPFLALISRNISPMYRRAMRHA